MFSLSQVSNVVHGPLVYGHLTQVTQVTEVTYCYGLASVVVFSRTTEPTLTNFGMWHL